MTDRISSRSSSPARRTGSTNRNKSTAPASKAKTTSRQKQASAQKTDGVQVSKEPGRAQGALQSKQLVQGLGDNLWPIFQKWRSHGHLQASETWGDQ